jgi:hypothetical protein
MLEYAANAITWWSAEELRAKFEASCVRQGADSAQTLADVLGVEGNQEQFWQTAGTNLRAGRIRLIFVADQIPPELQRIVEFLNLQMNPAEVLAVEIKQFVGPGLRTLVPKVVGQTAEAVLRKGGGPPERQWDETTFFQDLQSRRGPNEADVARRILEWARIRGLRVWWGKGKKDGSFYPMLDHNHTQHWLIAVWTYGRVEIEFQQMLTRSPFDEESARRELLHRLNSLDGIAIPDDAIARRPSIRLITLAPAHVLDGFLGTLDWAVSRIRESRSDDVPRQLGEAVAAPD